MIEFHGNFNYAEAKSTGGKLFWASVIFAALLCSTYFMVLTVSRFLDNPTSVSIAFYSEVRVSLPDVLLCNTGVFDSEKVRRNNIPTPLVRYLESYFVYNSNTNIGFENFSSFVNRDDHYVMESELKPLLKGSDFEHFILAYGISCPDFLISCTVGLAPFNCCELVEIVSHNGYGNCFAVKNLSKLGTQTSPGSESGLVIIIVSQLSGDGSQSESKSVVKDSIYLEVARNFTVPTYTHIPLVSFQSNYIALERQKTELSETRSGGCFSETRIPTNLCSSIAFAEVYRSNCNCTPIGYLTKDQILHGAMRRICTPPEDASCYKRFDFGKLRPEMVAKNCYKPNCNEMTFSVSQTSAELRQSYIRDLQNQHDSTVQYTKLSLYYPSLGYRSFTEFQAITFDTVLSAVGGNIGLFLGASIISILQFGIYSTTTALKIYRKFSKTKKHNITELSAS